MVWLKNPFEALGQQEMLWQVCGVCGGGKICEEEVMHPTCCMSPFFYRTPLCRQKQAQAHVQSSAEVSAEGGRQGQRQQLDLLVMDDHWEIDRPASLGYTCRLISYANWVC